MKRTKSHIIGTPFLKLHKLAHYINNINAAGNLLYGVGADHIDWLLAIGSGPMGRKNTELYCTGTLQLPGHRYIYFSLRFAAGRQ
jgi:hypothetical protein